MIIFVFLHIALNILYNLHVAAFFFNLSERGSAHFIYHDNVFSFPPLTPFLGGARSQHLAKVIPTSPKGVELIEEL